ncbi:MAG TPA: hypothetical protein VFM77_01350 [Terriglobales bacterium]|nr:hypothetical protein [Terriglobales bacterium]
MKSGLIKKVLSLACVCAFVGGVAAAKDKEKSKQPGAQVVDSGSFGVFSSGTRVATETFSIEQSATGSRISSQFKSTQGEQVADQTSEIVLTPSAELRSYQWKESAPEKMTASVAPNDTFLVETFTNGSDNKPHDQNFLLPASTTILDDYFFVHREVLAWKYLASACKQVRGTPNCPLHQKVQFGALNPHARTSMSVAIEFAGLDKISIRGSEVELSKFVLSSEMGDWVFWLDGNNHFKLVRLLNDGGTEVVRD